MYQLMGRVVTKHGQKVSLQRVTKYTVTFTQHMSLISSDVQDTSLSLLKIQDSIFKILLYLPAHLHVCIFYIMLLQ